jgi:ribosomal protein S18 acetylase RimI-like enzyme
MIQYQNVKIGYTLRESMLMLIRHATMEDLDAIEAIEAACFPPQEAASNESLTARVATYPNYFWLLVNDDDDDTRFPASVYDGTLVGFVNGMATNIPDLDDVMYEDASMHDSQGEWQMIFGVCIAPVYQHRGCASYLLRQVILDSTMAGRKGIVLTCKERLVGFYSRLGFIDEGISSSTHGNVAWHQMRLPLMHAVTGEISSSAAYADDDENPSAASVSPDTDTLEFPVVKTH